DGQDLVNPVGDGGDGRAGGCAACDLAGDQAEDLVGGADHAVAYAGEVFDHGGPGVVLVAGAEQDLVGGAHDLLDRARNPPVHGGRPVFGEGEHAGGVGAAGAEDGPVYFGQPGGY